jgi:dipeptidase E
MKLLLTSGGVTNPSIRSALEELLGKPIADCKALCIPTALYGHPQGSPAGAWRFITGQSGPHVRTGVAVRGRAGTHRTAQRRRGARWVPWVREADALLVDGGDATYLCHWMRESGLARLLPSLTHTVWVGVSAGSMVMTPRIGAYVQEWRSAPDDRTLGVVDFSIFPHLNHPMMPEQHPALRAAVGGRHRRPGLRDGRRDRDQGRRWRGGSGLPRSMDAVSRVTSVPS